MLVTIDRHADRIFPMVIKKIWRQINAVIVTDQSIWYTVLIYFLCAIQSRV